MIVDRYCWWLTLHKVSESSGLIGVLREYFGEFGIAEGLDTDGGPEFTAQKTGEFLKNCRAEVGVKTEKRLLQENASMTGDLDTDKLARALLQ